MSAQTGGSLATERARLASDQDVVDLTEDVEEAVIGDGAVAPVAHVYAISAAEKTGGAAGATFGVTTDDVLEESASGRNDAVSGGACIVGEELGDASEVKPVKRRRRANVDETEQIPVRRSARIAARTSQPERSTGADAASSPPTKRRRW